MEYDGQKLKQLRIELNLDIQQVVNITKIRPNIISAIEDGSINLNDPYSKAFISTLNNLYNNAKNNANYLNFYSDTLSNNEIRQTPIGTRSASKYIYVDNSDKTTHEEQFNETEPVVSYNNGNEANSTKNAQTSDVSAKSITRNSILEVKSKHKKRLKKPKKYFSKSLNITSKEIITYICLALFIFVVIFFVFIYDDDTFNFLDTEQKHETNANTNTDSIPVVEVKEKELFDYFKTANSVVLRAVCMDSAWIKLEIDGEKTDEMLMLPSTENVWTASEKIILATSNVGGIVFYKNDTILPNLGRIGSMIKNIIITHEGISNVVPLASGSAPMSVVELDSVLKSDNRTVVQQSTNTDKIVTKPRYRRKAKETPQPIIINEFSKPTVTKPQILEEKEEETP